MVEFNRLCMLWFSSSDDYDMNFSFHKDYWHVMELYLPIPDSKLKMRKSLRRWRVVYLQHINVFDKHLHQLFHKIMLVQVIWIWFYLTLKYVSLIGFYILYHFLQEGKMAIAAVATQLVCMVSKTNVQLGMLKAKV